MNTVDEERLLRLAAQLDADALAEIYDCYSPEIYRYAMRLAGNPQLAEDCVAEVFTRYLAALGKKKGPGKYLRAYLFRVAHNWIVDHYRRAKDEVGLAEGGEDFIRDDRDLLDVEHRQAREKLRVALQTLPAEQQQVVILRYLDEWEFTEIAASLHRSTTAIKGLLHRGMVNLRRAIGDRGGEW